MIDVFSAAMDACAAWSAAAIGYAVGHRHSGHYKTMWEQASRLIDKKTVDELVGDAKPQPSQQLAHIATRTDVGSLSQQLHNIDQRINALQDHHRSRLIERVPDPDAERRGYEKAVKEFNAALPKQFRMISAPTLRMGSASHMVGTYPAHGLTQCSRCFNQTPMHNQWCVYCGAYTR